ncbi:hypothetical protein PGTUg99_008853 [Puccinia graminis f. sp. tritici]|uniref:Uncharacterized protein n=2 Tax=Puccinia graminis f. sp. tritici TaxID=56615 RepID=A0A5B0S696_PUCGR|nr:hypothetical protein PGTUg99_008853 [Puccinia graminis f. sp. tritici]
MASPSPTLADIIVKSSQGPKINPFVDLIRGLDEKQNPPVDDSQTEGLLLSIATYIVVFLVCLAIISLPYLQGAGGHKRRHWVMKRQYLDGLFLGLRYNAFKSGYAAESFYGSAWLELRWYPSYCSFFTQAWSTWFVRASDASLKGKSSGIHPLAFNINLIALPLTAFILALILISAQVASMSAQNNAYKDLISSLTVMSLQWHPGQNYLSSPLFHTASIQFLDYGTKSVHLLARFRTTGLFWTFMAVPTFIFYVIGISTLLRVMYKRFRAVKGESEHESTVSSFDSFPKRLMANRKRNKSSKLRTSFIYLGVHYTMMSLTLFYHIIIGLIFYFSDDVAMVNKPWLELFMVLSNSGSYLLLLALMVQLLRIISEGREQAGMVSKKSGRNAEYNDCISDSSRTHPDIKLMT